MTTYTTTQRFPTANVVARALRRDFGSRTAVYNRPGYHVSGDGTSPALIGVHFSEAIPGGRSDQLRAKWLVQYLTEAGWSAERVSDDSALVRVTKVPTAAEQRASGWVWNPDS